MLLDDYLKEEACMKYINAKDILPNALVKELQNYIQGGYIYVPTNQLHQKRWGEISGYRQELQQRNQQIIEEFQKGSSVEKLFIRNKFAGGELPPAFVIQKLIRYRLVDRKQIDLTV